MAKEEWSLNFLNGCRFWIPYVLTPIVCIIGIIGNLVTIIVLTRKRMKSSTNTYLTALAVSDLLFLIFNLMLVAQHYPWLNSPDYMIYWKMWPIILWLTDATFGISVWLTVSFTLERYVAVCHPLKGRAMCTESRARRVIAVVGILCLLLTVTTPFEWTAEIKIDPVTNTTQPKHMTALGKNKTYKSIFYWFSSITFIIIPVIILTIFNSLLINAVRQSQKLRSNLTEDRRISNPSKSPNKKSSGFLQVNEESSGLKKTSVSKRWDRERQENKITMALASVVCLFLVCQLPTAITLIVSIFIEHAEGTTISNVMLGLGNIFNFLVLFNAACNFMLYCAMSDKYRQTLLMTFCPSMAYRHTRTNTFSSVASFRNSTVVHQISQADQHSL